MIHRSVSTWQQPTPAPRTPERSALLETVAGEILTLGPARLRVAVDGLTAAGKTSFGHELAERISAAGRPVLRATLDDFKNPWRESHLYDRLSGEGFYRNAFNYPSVTELLLEPGGPSGSGEVALCGIDPLTQIDHSAVKTRAAADAVLLVDGVFAFRPEINHHWDFRIWLDVDPETSIKRGAARDHDPEDAALHETRYLPAERVYLAEVDPLRLVDVVIDNRDLDRPTLTRTW